MNYQAPRRGWAHVKPLNFPQPGELAEYPQTVERCDERGMAVQPDPITPTVNAPMDSALEATI
jgi:hypothetical protein